MNKHPQIVEWFLSHRDQYVSGEEISHQLGISRTAVWKHIQAMKEEGYAFESSTRLGYKLVSVPDRIDALKLQQALRTTRFGRRVHFHEEVDSTQNAARILVREGAPEGTLVVADRQTMGRGRLGRQWHSPKGKGIYMSLIMKPALPLHATPQLTLVAAVALQRALRKLLPGVDPGIKWPNDLLIDGKKISGILLESSGENESLQHIIAGVGISANLSTEDYPEELRDRATSLLEASGSRVDRTLLLAEFLSQFEEMYELYLEQGFRPIRTLWEATSVTLGQTIRAMTPQGPTEGKAIGLDDFGGLVLRREDQTTYTVYSAEADAWAGEGKSPNSI